MSAGIDSVLARLEALMAGEVADATYPIATGRFARADDRTPIATYFEGGATARPFAIEPTTIADAMPETGPDNVTGGLVDATLGLVIRVGYLAGGGSLGSADASSLTREMAADWRRVRRCITHPANYDEQTTGLMLLTLDSARFGAPRPEGTIHIATLDLMCTALVREDWTEEP